MARPFRLRDAGMVKGLRLWAMIGLCVLSGSGWLLQAWPSEMAWPFGACLHFGLIGLLGLAVSVFQGGWSAPPRRRVAALATAGVCLFALPAAASQFTAGKVSEFLSVVVFCAVPLMTVLVSSVLGATDADASRLRGLMAPSIAGLSGSLLLFPIENPGTGRRWIFLGLVFAGSIAVTIAGVWMHRLMQGVRVAAAVAFVALASATALGSYGSMLGWPAVQGKTIAVESLRCAIFDLPIVWLTVWLAREIGAARLSARFLFVPLVTAIEGYAVMRQAIESKTLLALLLLCAGGVLLLVRDEPDEVPGLRLR